MLCACVCVCVCACMCVCVCVDERMCMGECMHVGVGVYCAQTNIATYAH